MRLSGGRVRGMCLRGWGWGMGLLMRMSFVWWRSDEKKRKFAMRIGNN